MAALNYWETWRSTVSWEQFWTQKRQGKASKLDKLRPQDAVISKS